MNELNVHQGGKMKEEEEEEGGTESKTGERIKERKPKIRAAMTNLCLDSNSLKVYY